MQARTKIAASAVVGAIAAGLAFGVRVSPSRGGGSGVPPAVCRAIAARSAGTLVDLQSTFSAFVEPRVTTPDGKPARLPAWFVARVTRAEASTTSARTSDPELSLATYLTTFPDQSAAWAAPSPRGVCLFIIDATGEHSYANCRPITAVESGRVAVRYRSLDGSDDIAGLVPDDVARVEVATVGGSREGSVVASNNAWTTNHSASVSYVVLRTVFGRHMQEVWINR
jgi:hypothetical protein